MHRFIHLIHFSKEDSHLHHACDLQVVVRDMNCYEAFVTCNKRREKSEHQVVTEAKNLTEANPSTPIIANIISSLRIVFISLDQFYY